MRINLRKNKIKNILLTVMLIVAMALTAVGCGNKKEAAGTGQTATGAESAEQPSAGTGDTGQTATEAESAEQPSAGTGDTEQPSAEQPKSQDNVLGEGKTKINFVVVDKEGNETVFEIHTDKETVGDALLEHGLIAGDESEYGLYVKEVNGITADYDVDKTYWAFYINGEYATTGVDSKPIKEGETYTLKIEK